MITTEMLTGLAATLKDVLHAFLHLPLQEQQVQEIRIIIGVLESQIEEIQREVEDIRCILRALQS